MSLRALISSVSACACANARANSRANSRTNFRLGCLFLALAATTPLHAQFDPARAYHQSEAVKRHYPDPAMRFDTPGFAPGRTDFTSQQEMLDFVYDLQRRSANVQVRVIGYSQEGRALPLLVLSNSGQFSAAEVLRLNRPVVFLQGQQHGNEPAGGEALLALAQELSTGALKPLLDRITVIIAPRCNPDGAYYFTRTPARNIDVNRDHVKMDLPETVALHRAASEYQPEVFIDAHEFSVATRWIEKFGVLQSYDLIEQHATNPNVPAAVTQMAEQVFRPKLWRDVERAGYTHFWYYTTSYDTSDKKVSMGGTAPDIGRNTAGLMGAISFLIESRGVGIGRESFGRRVHSHYVAIGSVLNTAADNAAELLRVVREARAATALQARKGDPGQRIAVTYRSPVVPQQLTMIDPASGELRRIDVAWEDSLAAQPVLTRQRPYAYVMPPAYTDVAQRLAHAGVEVRQLRKPATLEVESYLVNEKRVGTEVFEGHTRTTVTTAVGAKKMAFPAGAFVYLMTQTNANLAAVALEPESPSSFVTYGIIAVDRKGASDAPASASEVPVYRLVTPEPLDTRLFEMR